MINTECKIAEPWLLSVDPGKRYAGAAMFKDGKLFRCGRPAPGTHAAKPDHELALDTVAAMLEWAQGSAHRFAVVAEWMVHRGYGNKTGGNLLELCGVAASLVSVARASGFEGVLTPVSEWKGSARKAVHQPWILNSLDPGELAILLRCTGEPESRLRAVASKEASDIVDAVGIGLWALGRDARLQKPGKKKAAPKAQGSGLPDPGGLY